jgi:hypothetical protein
MDRDHHGRGGGRAGDAGPARKLRRLLDDDDVLDGDDGAASPGSIGLIAC